MRKTLSFGLMFIILFTFCSVLASALPVFPGAQGFGTDTRAAYGGSSDPIVYKVTNLNDAGTGSLRACLSASVPRICVFETSGIIELSSDLSISNPYITVAGQTAPSPGIMIKDYGLRISTHNVLLQHIIIRSGDDGRSATGSWDNLDSIQINSGYNIVLDHCTFTWGVDETASIWGSNIHDVTWSNDIIAEGLSHSAHTEGEHSKGLLIGGNPGPNPKNIAIIKNLFAHNRERNPQIKGDVSTVIANNVVYNSNTEWSQSLFNMDKIFEPIICSYIGVTIIDGLDTISTSNGIKVSSSVVSGSQIYQTDNLRPAYPSRTYVDGAGVTVSSPPISFSPHTILSRTNAYDYVIANAGSRPADRDPVDTRIVDEVISGTGHVKDTSEGLWPTYSVITSTFTTPSDPHGDSDGDGYTNLEEVLHSYLCDVEGTSSLSCGGATTQSCFELSGSCCSTGQSCSGGSFQLSSDCSTLCCVGGTCVTSSTNYCVADLGGTCCTSGQTCSGGSFSSSDDCGSLCCVGGGTCQTSASSNSYTVVQTSSAPVIDGDISEFANVDEITLTQATTGSSGSYKLMWDNTALYIAVSVSDTELNAIETTEDGILWDDDAVELAFDTLHNAGASQLTDDYKFLVNLHNIHYDTQAGDSVWDAAFSSAVVMSGTLNSNTDTDNGYTIEIAIPWSAWGISAPSNSDIWGFDLSMIDRISDGTDLKVTWSNSDSGSFNNPDGWGDLEFSSQVAETGIIIDDADSEFTTVGTWSSSSYPNPYSTTSLWSTVNEGSTARWQPSIPQAGLYDVYAWWTAGTGRVIDAKYTVNHASGSNTAIVNQKLNGGQWNLLGQYSFNSGTSGNVVLSDASTDPDYSTSVSNSVCADAIKFVYVGSIPTTNYCVSDLGGSCCSSGQTCEGGSFSASDDCGSLCCVSGTCTTPTTCHDSDTSCDGCISMTELMTYIGRWKAGDGVTMTQLMESIGLWKAGC